MQLTCPKCHGSMRQYERAGVTLDQCSECRGIFLDRGELDRLIDAENSWHGAAPPPPQPAYPPQSRGYSDHDRGGYGHGSGHKKKRKSFLDELFD